MNAIKIFQIQRNLCLGLMTLLLINLTASNMSGTISTPTPEPTPVTILVDGETIILVPGNIASYNYDLIIEDPEFSSRVDWEFINGLWEPMPFGVDIPIDICQVTPIHPDCIGVGGIQTPTALPGMVEEVQNYTDPYGRFVFNYPAGWYTTTVEPDPAGGVRVLDAPTLEEATQWISFDVFPNPEKLSVPAWFEAGHGQVWVGEVTEEQEEEINWVPVLRQRLENNAPTVGEPYVYTLIWWPAGKYMVLWTAWPGEQPETLNLLERMVTGFRSYE